MKVHTFLISIKSAQNSTLVGKHYEDIAVKYLLGQNFKLIYKNWRCKTSEIDIIMLDKSDLVFIEVKGRINHSYESFEETLNFHKRHRLNVGIRYFLYSNPKLQNLSWRFDFVGISKINANLHRVHYYKNISLF